MKINPHLKTFLKLFAALPLMGCSSSESKAVTMPLVYQYPSNTGDPQYYSIIKHLAALSKLSLKEEQQVYYDGENYYIYPQKSTLFSISSPKTNKKITQKSVILSEQEVKKLLRESARIK